MSSGVADLAIAVARRLVSGPAPSDAERVAYFGPRGAAGEAVHWLDHGPPPRLHRLGADNAGLIDLCRRYDSIELWFGPEPNAQLTLVRLLDYWREHAPDARQLLLRELPSNIEEVEPPGLDVTPRHLELASQAWQAYAAPTPEPWFGLLQADFHLLAQLHSCVLALLQELPDKATGLGATEMRLLDLIRPGGVQPFELFQGRGKPNTGDVFDYWETGALLDGLARCGEPAIAGLQEGPFSLQMHDDPARLERYKQSRLSLTELGAAVLARRDDFSRHNRIHRWWGGTELGNGRLWRWDAGSRTPVRP